MAIARARSQRRQTTKPPAAPRRDPGPTPRAPGCQGASRFGVKFPCFPAAPRAGWAAMYATGR